MAWDKEELKKAIDHSSNFKQLKKGQQVSIRRGFDKVFFELSKVVQNEAAPRSIFRQFSEGKKASAIATPRNANAAGNGPPLPCRG